MERDILFSIIIPTYNRADFIAKSIGSVLAQTYRHFELIIIDDGSTDNTADIVAPYLNETVMYKKFANGERGAARNRGVELAKGDYITFLDSDDLYYPNYLSNANQVLNEMQRPPFFHQGYEIKNIQNGKIELTMVVPDNQCELLVEGNPLSCMGVLVKSEIIKANGFIEDRELAGSEDWELWVRLAAQYGLRTSQTITGALLIHDKRSVFHFDENKLLSRKNISLHSILNNAHVQSRFKGKAKKFNAYFDAYIAIHLAISNKKKEARNYLWKIIKEYPAFVFDVKFLGLLKNIF
ncbi:MAG: glycosyltransferase family 2 protein [Bacteroidetes bacterium]|nr:glycosyltransferase family 2 protein [Bacteroidota bacterium]